jgi:hypothetical protein
MPPLRMPHHATLCSSCLNCQSNFRLKVFLLFLTPTAVSFFVYSFFCFSHASVLPDFLNWLFTSASSTHATSCNAVFQQSCSSSRVPAFVFQHSCSSSRVPAVQHSCSSSRVPAVVFQQSCSSSRVPAFVFQHLRLSICDSALVFQHLRFGICDSAFVFQHLCFTFVLQHLCSCFSNFVPASAIVFRLLCSNTCACSITNRLSLMTTLTICVSFCVPALFQHCVSASVFAFVLPHLCCSICVSASVFVPLFSINNRLPSMTTLIICVISVVAIFPTISPFGIDGNMYMSFISPPFDIKGKGLNYSPQAPP